MHSVTDDSVSIADHECSVTVRSAKNGEKRFLTSRETVAQWNAGWNVVAEIVRPDNRTAGWAASNWRIQESNVRW